jgi:hypothetical protein
MGHMHSAEHVEEHQNDQDQPKDSDASARFVGKRPIGCVGSSFPPVTVMGSRVSLKPGHWIGHSLGCGVEER